MTQHRLFLLLWVALLSACTLFSPIRSPKRNVQQILAYTGTASEPLVSAHRGGRAIPGFPENALETFTYTLSKVPEAIIEFDVNMTRDSVLILLHDDSLDRTTSTTGAVRDFTYTELTSVQLKDDAGQLTAYHVPTLREALRWAKKSRALLTIDIKRGVPASRVMELLRQHDMASQAAVITYTLEDALVLHRAYPEYMLSVTVRNNDEWQRVRNSGISFQHMVAFTGTTLSDASLYDTLHRYGIKAILGTLGNLDKSASAKGDDLYCHFVSIGADILATDRPENAARAIEDCP